MKVAFHTLGCKVNFYETQAINEKFKAMGYEVVDFNEQADVYVVNTCAVTKTAAQKSRQILHRARRLAPEAYIIAAGCYAEEAKEELMKDEAVDLVLDNKEKNEIAECGITAQEGHVRAYLKIQDGCNRFCSYCIIPYLRGRSQSRRIEDILKEARGLCRNGYKEIVLTGIDVSSFEAAGFEPGADSLAALIEELNALEGLERIRLSSAEVSIITKDFMKRLAACEKVCPHFHLSLQSGSDSVLKRMNRHYTTEEYLEAANLIRKYYENPAITTDVIVGFPGETEEEFEETLEFAKCLNFARMHIFPYSRRKGTRADKLPGQLTKAEKAKRAEILAKEADVLEKKYAESFAGKSVEILAEESITENGKEYLLGFTPEYIKVKIEKGENEINDMIEINEFSAENTVSF